MRIAFGADSSSHLTGVVIDELRRRGHAVSLHGPPSGEALDWADVAREVGELVALGAAEQAVLCCWTGTGVAIAANKVPGVRAAACYDPFTARNSREHNNANLLTLGSRVTGSELAKEIVRTWLSSSFGGGRHQGRFDKVLQVERCFLKDPCS